MKTPLYEQHLNLNAKMIDFFGWKLPMQYSGIVDEHKAVRRCAGLFDVSHMGEIVIKGDNAENFVQKIVTNDISRMADNQVMYSPMCYPDGGTVDDILVYRFSKTEYLLVVNAANVQKDLKWILENSKGKVKIEDKSSKYAQIALQGPKAENILQKLTKIPLKEIKFFWFYPDADINGINAIVSRTGYTGEDGFEIYTVSKNAPVLWDMILKAGENEGLVPAGLGARDTLRFEAALPLYGHELSETISPLEAGLEAYVKLEKEDFLGKQALLNQKMKGIRRKLVAFRILRKGIPRSGFEIKNEGKKIGFVTSGSYSPTLKENLGLALIDSKYAEEGGCFDVIVRGKALRAEIIKKPFYRKKYKK